MPQQSHQLVYQDITTFMRHDRHFKHRLQTLQLKLHSAVTQLQLPLQAKEVHSLLTTMQTASTQQLLTLHSKTLIPQHMQKYLITANIQMRMSAQLNLQTQTKQISKHLLTHLQQHLITRLLLLKKEQALLNSTLLQTIFSLKTKLIR